MQTTDDGFAGGVALALVAFVMLLGAITWWNASRDCMEHRCPDGGPPALLRRKGEAGFTCVCPESSSEGSSSLVEVGVR